MMRASFNLLKESGTCLLGFILEKPHVKIPDKFLQKRLRFLQICSCKNGAMPHSIARWWKFGMAGGLMARTAELRAKAYGSARPGMDCRDARHWGETRGRGITRTSSGVCGALAQLASAFHAHGARVETDLTGRDHAGGGIVRAPALGMARSQFGQRLGRFDGGRIRQISFGSAASTCTHRERFALRRVGAGRGTDAVTNTHQQAGGILVVRDRGAGRGNGRCVGRRRRGIAGGATGASKEQDQDELSHRHIIPPTLRDVKRHALATPPGHAWA